LSGHQPRSETREEALELLRQLARELGVDSPTIAEWKEGRGDAPSLAWYERTFGSWGKALTAAGLPSRRRGDLGGRSRGRPSPGRAPVYNDQDCIQALQAFVRDHGQVPTIDQWNKDGRRPTIKVFERIFGGWSDAVVAAGYEPHAGMELGEGVVTDEHVVEAMARIEKGASMARVSDDLGVPRSSLSTAIRRYRKARNLPPMDLRPRGAPSAEEREAQQLADPERAREKWDKTYRPEQT
jgi:hypothetical protein